MLIHATVCILCMFSIMFTIILPYCVNIQNACANVVQNVAKEDNGVAMATSNNTAGKGRATVPALLVYHHCCY